MSFSVEQNKAGFWVLADEQTREQMHPLGDPLAESTALYVESCGVVEFLKQSSLQPLVVWDVGLGMASNALACIRAARALSPRRPLWIFSFEKNVAGFRTALQAQEKFPHLQDPAADVLERHGLYEESGLRWSLVEGDFFATCEKTPPPEVVFYDPFSRRVNPEFWTEAAFRQIRAAADEKPCVLSTYANARAVREAMQNAGWSVSVGPGFGRRNATTVARWAPSAA